MAMRGERGGVQEEDKDTHKKSRPAMRPMAMLSLEPVSPRNFFMMAVLDATKQEEEDEEDDGRREERD